MMMLHACLARAAKIVRRDILANLLAHLIKIAKKICTHSLLALFDIFHNSPNIKPKSMSQVTLKKIAQYNTSIRR